MYVRVHTQRQPNRGDNLSLPMVPGYCCVGWCGTISSHILPRGRWSEGSHSIYELPCFLSSVLKHNTFITAKMWPLNQHDGTQIPLSLFECCHVIFWAHNECIICVMAIMIILYSCVLNTDRLNKLNKSYCCMLDVKPIISDIMSIKYYWGKT